MIKNICRLEQIMGGRVYHLLCDNDSPVIEMKEALFQFQKFIGQVEDAAKQQKEENDKIVEIEKTE